VSETTPQPSMIWNGPMALASMLVDLDSVELDPRNARRHPEANLEAIKRSISTFGQLKPIVVKGSRILAGNGTWTAIKALGWTHVAVVQVPEEMSDPEALAFALADNKTTDLSEWDFEEVSELLKELPPDLLDATGFADFEREPLMQGEWSPPSVQAGQAPPGQSAGTVVVHVSMTKEQHAICEQAVDKLRASQEDSSMTFGRALELICADFLAGA